MIDLKRLRYFMAVATARSFTKAARALNMAQPPLSRRIQELEEDLGAALFDREARPLELTAAGRLFYEQAVQVLQKSDQMEATMKQFVVAERRRFVIGLVPSGFHARLPQVIRRYRQNAPDVDLSLIEMTSLEQVTALKEGRIGAGLGRIRIEDAALTREVLRDELMMAALPPGHSPNAGREALDLAELARLPLIVYPKDPRPSYADHILSLCHDHGVALTQVIEVRELQTAMVMVAAGMGACIVPISARLAAHPDVQFRKLKQRLTSPIILTHRVGDQSYELQALFRTFADLYKEWGLPLPQAVASRL